MERKWYCMICNYEDSLDKVRKHCTRKKHTGYAPIYNGTPTKELAGREE